MTDIFAVGQVIMHNDSVPRRRRIEATSEAVRALSGEGCRA